LEKGKEEDIFSTLLRGKEKKGEGQRGFLKGRDTGGGKKKKRDCLISSDAQRKNKKRESSSFLSREKKYNYLEGRGVGGGRAPY